MHCPVRHRLRDASLELPEPPQPGGSYRPAVEADGLLSVAAQFPIHAGRPAWTGRLGQDLGVEQGVEAARLAALNVLAQIDRALGGFDRLVRVVHMDAFMLTTPDFVHHARVLDGASDLLHLALAEKAGHTRSLLGCASLPLGMPIELVVKALVQR